MAAEAARPGGAPPPVRWLGRSIDVVDVWETNLDEEMYRLRALLPAYPVVSMASTFPGIVARPIWDSRGRVEEYHYLTMQLNADSLRVIQIGITLANDKGELPESRPTWQFNFRFDVRRDRAAVDSIQLLRAAGVDFAAHAERGIDPEHFGELLYTSGLVLVPGVRWLTFHSGYDLAFLLRLLTCTPLPSSRAAFLESLRMYFPWLIDVKAVARELGKAGSLAGLTSAMGVEGVPGNPDCKRRPAAWDSLRIHALFTSIRDTLLASRPDLVPKLLGSVYGIGGSSETLAPSSTTASSTPAAVSSPGAAGAMPAGRGRGRP